MLRTQLIPEARIAVAHGQMRELSSRLANALLGLGLRRGDRVAYAAGNHLEYFVLEMALLKSGLVKVPLNPRLTGLELIAALGLADVRLVVTDDVTADAIEQAVAEDLVERQGAWAARTTVEVGDDIAVGHSLQLLD